MNVRAHDLTTEQKSHLVTGVGPWNTFEITERGIETVKLSDGPHGLRAQTLTETTSHSPRARSQRAFRQRSHSVPAGTRRSLLEWRSLSHAKLACWGSTSFSGLA